MLDVAFEVHTELGAGFLERIYEWALCHELALRKVPFERQKRLGFVLNFGVAHFKDGIQRMVL